MPARELEFNCINILPEPMLLVQLDGSIVSANQAALDLFRCPAKKLTGRNFSTLTTESSEIVLQYLRNCSRSAQFHIGGFSFSLGTGSQVACRCDGVRLASPQGEVLVIRLTPRTQSSSPFLVLNEQIESLNRAQHGLENEVRARTHDLLEAQARLRELSAHLLQAQDQERRKWARELHDSTGQSLTAIQLNLSLLLKGVAEDSEAASRLSQTIELTNQVMGEIRTVSHLLHPPLLDEAGLTLALRNFVEGFEERSRISVSLDLPSITDRFHDELETAVFRIVQECLTNIHRHSGSPDASVSLKITKDLVQLEVRDRGRGMATSAGSNGHRSGVGIRGMHERVRLLGGTLEIGNLTPGTRVKVTLPMQVKEKSETHERSSSQCPLGSL
jgi:signal transduction histidine kinase